MTQVSIDLSSATTEQLAAQVLLILRANANGRPAAGYFPGCTESILAFEFAPIEKGLDVKGGVLRQGGAVSMYGGGAVSPALRKRYLESLDWLRSRGFIRRDHTQTSDQFMELTAEGVVAQVDSRSMTFVIPRPWTHWRTEYERGIIHIGVRKDGDLFSGSAFVVGDNKFATCEHNFCGEVVAYVDGAQIEVDDVRTHESADVAVFSLVRSIGIAAVLPVRDELPSPGEEVAALGFPAVPQRQPVLSISVGAVEALPSNYGGNLQYIQISAATSGGNSGGPVLDRCGRVIGIVSENTYEAVADGSAPARAFSQVVPVRYLRDVLG